MVDNHLFPACKCDHLVTWLFVPLGRGAWQERGEHARECPRYQRPQREPESALARFEREYPAGSVSFEVTRSPRTGAYHVDLSDHRTGLEGYGFGDTFEHAFQDALDDLGEVIARLP